MPFGALRDKLPNVVVSIPEKTLEHWASIYLTYRYRSHAALWWPAHGEDINVGNLPPTPGKAVQLELKTTYLNSAGTVHQVKIRLEQLDRYLRRPHGQRPYYVFPWPRWTGALELAACADGVPPTEIGFRRAWGYSNNDWWFAEWLCALTANQVAAIVSSQLSMYRSGMAVRDQVTLVTFDLRSRQPVTTWADGQQRNAIPWLDLWDRLNACGEPSWPQLVRLPASLLGDGSWVPHAHLAGLLAEATSREGDDLVTLTSDDDDGFSPLAPEPLQDVAGEERAVVADDGFRQDLDHRIVAFLQVEALRLR